MSVSLDTMTRRPPTCAADAGPGRVAQTTAFELAHTAPARHAAPHRRWGTSASRAPQTPTKSQTADVRILRNAYPYRVCKTAKAVSFERWNDVGDDTTAQPHPHTPHALTEGEAASCRAARTAHRFILDAHIYTGETVAAVSRRLLSALGPGSRSRVSGRARPRDVRRESRVLSSVHSRTCSFSSHATYATLILMVVLASPCEAAARPSWIAYQTERHVSMPCAK